MLNFEPVHFGYLVTASAHNISLSFDILTRFTQYHVPFPSRRGAGVTGRRSVQGMHSHAERGNEINVTIESSVTGGVVRIILGWDLIGLRGTE